MPLYSDFAYLFLTVYVAVEYSHTSSIVVDSGCVESISRRLIKIRAIRN